MQKIVATLSIAPSPVRRRAAVRTVPASERSLVDAANIDEAIDWASQIPGAWLGRVVVQPCIDFGTEG